MKITFENDSVLEFPMNCESARSEPRYIFERTSKLAVEEDILIMATRYALGGRTFAPTTINENIKYNIHLLSHRALTIILRDIDSADSLGDDRDIEIWNEIKYLVKNKIKSLKGE